MNTLNPRRVNVFCEQHHIYMLPHVRCLDLISGLVLSFATCYHVLTHIFVHGHTQQWWQRKVDRVDQGNPNFAETNAARKLKSTRLSCDTTRSSIKFWEERLPKTKSESHWSAGIEHFKSGSKPCWKNTKTSTRVAKGCKICATTASKKELFQNTSKLKRKSN